MAIGVMDRYRGSVPKTGGSGFALAMRGEVRFSSSVLLNHRISDLKPGQVVSGYLAFVLGKAISATGEEKLEGTLLIYDQFSRCYPYELALVNTQEIIGNGDRHCSFVPAAELEQERAEQVAKEAGFARNMPGWKSEPEENRRSPLMKAIDDTIAELTDR